MALFVCPNCSHTQDAPDVYIGRVARCVKCDARAEIAPNRNGLQQQNAQPIPASPRPKPAEMAVTTGDIKADYEIIGPVYFQLSNKGLFSSQLSKLIAAYQADITRMRTQGQIDRSRADWGFLYGEFSVGQSEFEMAFYIAVQELKKRARLLGADAIICMRQDIDLDTNGFQFFYLQMYGTAVRFT